MEFAERIRELRIGVDMSVAELAKCLKKAESTVRMWEIGKAKPGIGTLVKLSGIFNCTTDYLLGLSDNRIYTIDDKDAIIFNLEVRVKDLDKQLKNMINAIEATMYK